MASAGKQGSAGIPAKSLTPIARDGGGSGGRAKADQVADNTGLQQDCNGTRLDKVGGPDKTVTWRTGPR